MKKTLNMFKVFTHSVIIYLVIAFLLAWILFLLPVFLGPGEGAARATAQLITWSVAMWAPGLAAIIATRWTEKKRVGTLRIGHLGKPAPYFWAWILPILMVLLTGILTWAVGLGSVDVGLSRLDEAPSAFSESALLTPGQRVALQVISGLLIGPLVNALFTVGEEIGWRGFLLPRLLPLGQTRAILATGIIWGVWHAPVIAQGHNYPGRPFLGIFLMVVFTTLLGFLLGWLYFETRSPWAPALAHGTVNAVAGLPLVFLTIPEGLWGGTLTSVTGFLVMGAFVFLLYLRKELPVLG